LPFVHRSKDAIAGNPQLTRVPARVEDGERPLEPITMLGGGNAHAVLLGPYADDAFLPAPMVVVDQPAHSRPAADRAAHDDRGIPRLDRDIPALATAWLYPVGGGDGAAVRLARDADRPVVLLRAVHAVRPLVVGAHVIELRGRLVVDGRPGLSAVVRHARTAIVALDHPARVGRIDPEVMIVSMWRGYLREGPAAVR